MTATARDRRDRLRAMLADLKMPGALEAVRHSLFQSVSSRAAGATNSSADGVYREPRPWIHSARM